MHTVPAARWAARISSASLMAKHMGFSVTTCFFARSASTMTWPWESALRTMTASIFSFSSSR